MKYYNEVFQGLRRKKEGALVCFIVIGDPDYETSLEIAKTIVEAGADILELGLPFSDPIADGHSIQSADVRALSNGMNTDKVFGYVKELREFTDVPIGLLSYYNLIYQYGMQKFYEKAFLTGVNSILVADMPVEESDLAMFNSEKNKIDTVFMISPITDNKRIRKIAGKVTGFIYAVSRLGITGARHDLEKSTLSLIRRIKKFTNKPICVGFGISKPEHVKDVIKAGADGAIVGSAIVDIIAGNLRNKDKMLKEIASYVNDLKAATRI